jgi:hypothetical protein
MVCRRFIRATTTAMAVMAISLPASASSSDAAIRLLRRAATPQRDSSHLALLVSLRQLRDPTMPAFLTPLLDSPDWQVQVHATLGLLEVTPEMPIDAALLDQIDPDGQEPILAEMIDADRLDTATMQTLIAWEGLRPMSRAILLAELVVAGEKVDVEQLRTLTEDEDHRAALLAWCLLARLETAGAIDQCRSRLATIDVRTRTFALEWLVEAVRQYKLVEALPLVIEAVDTLPRRRGAQDQAVLTVLQLDVEKGLEIWNRRIDANPSYGRRVRLGLLLLASNQKIPMSAFTRLGNDEEMLQAIIDVGTAFDRDADPVPAMITLLDLRTPRSTDWVMGHASTLPPEAASRIYAHMIEAFDTATRPDDVSLVIEAAARLFELDPTAILHRLASAEDDSQLQQVLLLSLFEPDASSRVGQVVSGLPRSTPRRADSLAVILVAKHLEAPSLTDLDRLAVVAAGGGQVSELLQAQAAWLLLRRRNAIDDAVAAIFSD